MIATAVSGVVARFAVGTPEPREPPVHESARKLLLEGMLKHVLAAGCLASLLFGCGGKSNSDVFDGDGGSGGTAGDGGGDTGHTASGGTSTGGDVTSMSVTSGSSGGASTSGGASMSSATTGNGGSPPDRCQLPILGGSCMAYFPSYGYSAETGRCESFVYGGCDGNDNRFETLDECLAACDPNGRSACETTPDCTIDHGCCGFCGTASVDQLIAVNVNYASYNSTECGLVDCEYCEPPPELAQFGARCDSGTCEVYDVRNSDLSACETDADCRLRLGLGCCEGCSGDEWVAVSTSDDVQQELCGGEPQPCPACATPQPEDLQAICGADGHCAVSTLD